MPAVLLTDAEVAERLRCSKQTVAKLRLHGRLPYIPGRPPLIAEADLTAYLEQASHETASRVVKRNRIVEPENGIAAARLRARRDWMLGSMKRKKRGAGGGSAGSS